MNVNKKPTQQIFHPGLFKRTRSSPVHEISNDEHKNVYSNPVHEFVSVNVNQNPTIATACLPSTSRGLSNRPYNLLVQWQRVLIQNEFDHQMRQID